MNNIKVISYLVNTREKSKIKISSVTSILLTLFVIFKGILALVLGKL